MHFQILKPKTPISETKKEFIDFKYSAFRTEESKEKYKKQLYLYKMAYERAFQEKIDKVVLLSLKTGESFQL